MKTTILWATTLALTALGAHAQDPKEKRWRAQIGVGLPTAESGKSFVGGSAGHSALSYDLGRVGDGTWGLYTTSVMRGRDKNNTTTSQTAAGFGIQYRTRHATSPSLYYGAGVGGYSLMTSSAVENGDTTVTTTTEKGVFGGRVFIGQDFGKKYFAELGYTFVGQATLGATKRNTSHASLGVGLRF